MFYVAIHCTEDSIENRCNLNKTRTDYVKRNTIDN